MAESFCLTCGTIVPEWDSAYYARSMLCIPCWQNKQREASTQPCGRCAVRTKKDELAFFREKYLCPYCLREAKQEVHDKECASCKKWIENWEKKFQMPDGRFICHSCHEKSKGKFGMRCEKCGKMPKYPFSSPDGKVLCEICAIKVHKGQQAPLFARAVSKVAAMLSSA